MTVDPDTTPEPSHAWLDVDDVRAWLQLDDTANDRVVELVRTAAASYVEGCRRDLFVPASDEAGAQLVLVDSLGGDVITAGILAASRLWARRSSPAGLVSFGDMGTEVLRADPDVDRLLGLGRFAKPRVG